MNTQPPVISVVLPVYNAGRYLAQAVESVLAQTFRDFELIAVDDGSTDNSRALLETFARRDPRVRVISRPNTGIVGALNDGLAAARGRYIARMDGDDVADPERFARQAAALDAAPDCVALGSAVRFIDPEGRPLKIYRPPAGHNAIRDELSWGNGGALVHPAVVFRRDALEACGGYRQEFIFIEDLDLYVRLLRFGRLANLPDVLLSYRQHPRSVNHRIGDRSALTARIIAPLRSEMGLPPMPAEAIAAAIAFPAGIAACRRRWALDAAEGGNLAAARANALRALWHNPLEKANWSCLHYVLGLKQPVAPTA